MKQDIPTLQGTSVTLRALEPKDKVARLRAGRHPEIVRMYGADHSLEFTGEAVRSVQALEKVVRRIQDFFVGGSSAG
jgi:hypothetical protein